ncbi:hypothetical protein ACIP88_00680 [Streptomyces uncialis]|uniref:hypothetical protein n=1 Tax=Streptomyces uncialis TaxID=1048205 RepID=UPI00382F077B
MALVRRASFAPEDDELFGVSVGGAAGRNSAGKTSGLSYEIDSGRLSCHVSSSSR